jgi:preprotein translocase subunit YajC
MLWALVALFAILAFGGLFIFLVYRRREKKE